MWLRWLRQCGYTHVLKKFLVLKLLIFWWDTWILWICHMLTHLATPMGSVSLGHLYIFSTVLELKTVGDGHRPKKWRFVGFTNHELPHFTNQSLRFMICQGSCKSPTAVAQLSSERECSFKGVPEPMILEPFYEPLEPPRKTWRLMGDTITWTGVMDHERSQIFGPMVLC